MDDVCERSRAGQKLGIGLRGKGGAGTRGEGVRAVCKGGPVRPADTYPHTMA